MIIWLVSSDDPHGYYDHQGGTDEYFDRRYKAIKEYNERIEIGDFTYVKLARLNVVSSPVVNLLNRCQFIDGQKTIKEWYGDNY